MGRALLLLAFFLSGAAALAYEVAWTRGLLVLLGSTAAASAVVLGTFVGALGFGARWGGRAASATSRPLALYGGLEVLAALWARASLAVVEMLAGPYVGLARAAPVLEPALRVLTALLVVGPGAFLLGATLPALVRHWTRDGAAGARGTALLYGVNTLGAVAGALGTGFVSIEAIGVSGTVRLAAVTAGVVGFLALLAGRRTPPFPAPSSADPAEGGACTAPAAARTLGPAFAAFLCGFVGLGLEVAGFRVLSFFVEGFTVTFAAMLGVFVLGLALGSLVLGPRLSRTEHPERALGVLLGLVGGWVLLAATGILSRLHPLLQDAKDALYAGAASPADLVAGLRGVALVGASVFFLVPAFLLGPTFALCVRWAEAEGDAPARAVGRVYLWNSVGTLAAPAAVTFLLVPAVGVHAAFGIVGFLALLLGPSLFHLRRRLAISRGRAFAVPVAACAVVAFVALAVHLDDGRLLRETHVLKGRPGRTLVDVRTDAVTTASVVDAGDGDRFLYTDDFAAAATGREYRYMRMLGHLPALLAKEPTNAMVIAFGTGTTAGAVAAHPDVKRIEVVEVSRAVLDLADRFRDANRGVLSDPRVVVRRDDGRNALLLHEADLDVVTLEPLMPYAPAGLPFYTREFYETAKGRLREGGVLCQWVPVHAMPAAMYAALVRTFFDVFPDGSLWFFEQSSALIGRKGTAAPDGAAVRRRMEGVRADLEAAGYPTPELVLSAYVAGGRTVLAAPRPTEPWADRLVTDDLPFPEFHPTPRAGLKTSFLADTLGWLRGLVDLADLPDVLDGLDAGARARLRLGTEQALQARTLEAQADLAPPSAQAGKLYDAAAKAYAKALDVLPGEGALSWRRARTERVATTVEVLGLFRLAAEATKRGASDDAKDLLRRAERLARAAAGLPDAGPSGADLRSSRLLHMATLLRLGRCDSALGVLGDGADMAEARRAVEAHRAGGTPPTSGELAALFRDLPPCAPDGGALLASPLARFAAALAKGDARSLRAAARDLEDAARRDGLEREALLAVRGAVAEGLPPTVVAVRAGLLGSLDPADGTLADLLVANDAAARAAALAEAEGARKHLRDHLDAFRAAVTHTDATVRAAAADAAGADGDASLRRPLVDLLLDPERAVRVAAATALHPAASDLLERYDPDAPEPARRAVADELRRRWP